MLVDQQAAAFGGDAVERDIQLRAAIAAQAVKDVAGEALRVDAHQRRLRRRSRSPIFEHHGFFGAGACRAFETVDPKDAELGGKVRFGHFREPWRSRMYSC